MVIKKLVAIVIIFHFTILSFSSTSAEPHDFTSPEEFVKEYLCVKMNTLISKNIDDIDDYYSKQSDNSQKYMLFTKQELLQDYLIAYALNDYAIEKVAPEVRIISSTNVGHTATVDAILKTSIYWNAANALGKPIVGTKCERHLLILSREKNKWRITVDQYMTNRGHSEESIKQDTNRLSDTIDQLKKEAKETLEKSKRSKPARLTMVYSEAQIKISSKSNRETDGCETESKISKPTSTSSYNRDGVYNWAHTYWDNYSTAFVNLGDQKWEGGDCTNFISQCLKAGGSNYNKTGTFIWYYDSNSTAKTSDDSYSWTWSTARGLNYIILGKYKANESGPKGSESVITGDSEYAPSIGQFIIPGDIIQYQWKADMKITHSAVIVDMLYNSSKERYEPVIAEHTNNSWYTPWTNNAYKTHFVHITDVN